ncbi:MAG: alpha/beta hydrolase [Betaproteobacteria bacterium]
MSQPASKNPLKHLRASDLRGIAQLATDAAISVARIAEGVHQSVWDTLGVAGRVKGQTGGITGFVYQAVQGVAQLLGRGADALLATLQTRMESKQGGEPATPQREAALAVLNGVMGDRLLASKNPLATPMTLRHQGVALNWAAPPAGLQPKVLLMVHGLCMNDLQWSAQHQGQVVNHGELLASALGCSPVYLRYNSGLHVSQNGHDLSRQLEQLTAHGSVEELSVLAHSMGGLLIRSALHIARQQGLRWPDKLRNIVFLGTPQHGAPLERAGNWLDTLLGSTPYTAPLAQLGKLRSAGVTDLRYGLVLDQDWQGRDRFERDHDRRQLLPLPEGVACYAVAATLAGKRSAVADRLIGDGLVPLRSALGQHDEAQRCLIFAKDSQWIAYRTGHMELLSRPEVTQQLLHWLAHTNN